MADVPKNAYLSMVFESGRSARIMLDIDEAKKMLQSFADGANIVAPITFSTTSGPYPVGNLFIRGSRVTHAVVFPDTAEQKSVQELVRDAIPQGFHDGVNRDLAPSDPDGEEQSDPSSQ